MPFNVVLYSYSTSNRNQIGGKLLNLGVVLYFILHQATTKPTFTRLPTRLCYISIPHQTTTTPAFASSLLELCYILIYIKPQQVLELLVYTRRCIIFLFHIKPQPHAGHITFFSVVLYPYSTSNHNRKRVVVADYIVVLYFHSTSNHG